MKYFNNMNNTNMLKRLFTLLFVLGMGMATAWAYDFSAVAPSGQTLYYTITDADNHYVQMVAPGGNSSSGWNNYTKPTGDITLSGVVSNNGIDYVVTSIDGYAFINCSGLTGELVIPNSVITIGYFAFCACNSLTSVIIGESVTTIGGYAFRYCSSLTSVTIGNSVTSIGDYAFLNCGAIETVYFNAENCTRMYTQTGTAYYIDPNNYQSVFSGNFVLYIGENVTLIPEYAFKGSGITSVIGGNSLTSIGQYAFYDCSGLTSLEIPNSVTTIGSYAFYRCTGLTSVTMGNSVTSIGDWALYYCRSLTELICCASTPPSVSYHTFYSVPTNCELWVPEGCASSYSNVWTSFVGHIYEMTESTISVDVMPEGSGTVSGSGTLQGNTICTLNAIPNENYGFAYWNEEGVIISRNSSYSFIVRKDRELVATFASHDFISFVDANVKALCVANWDTNNDGELSYAEAALVTDLGSVFKGNSSITSFNELGHFIGLSNIAEYAFQSCSNLTSITIPNSVKSIGNNAFQSCSGLTSVFYTGDITQWCGITFAHYTSNPLYYGHNLYIDNQLVTELVIPNSVTTIGQYAFYGCSGLTSLEIPNSVTTIGSYAFYGCNGLTSMNYTGDITQWCAISFGNDSSNPCCYTHCFYINNELVTDLVIPNSVTTIGNYAFYGCSGLTSVVIPNSVTTIGNYAFYGCSGLTGELVIPNSVTSIGQSAFCGCSDLTSVTIGNSVTSIGSTAFYNCSGLTSVTIGEGVTSIGNRVFWNCPNLTTVYFNAINSSISFNNTPTNNPIFSSGSGSNDASPIVILSIGENVNQIPDHAFRNSPNLASVAIPNSVTAIGQYAFSGCSGLTGELVIPNSVTAIGQSAFSGCSYLTGELVIPNSVTTIGDYAFYSCHGFTSLIIGNSVTTIGDRSFQIPGLTSIAVLAETPPAVTQGYYHYSAFNGVSTSIPVYVPCESASAYQSSSDWNSFTNITAVCSASISASASSNQGGTVAGDGTFDFGATCTLSATPNPGYHFWYWTENGVVVSNDASYSFTVVHDRDLVAVFSTSNPADAIQFADANVKALCVANWDSNGDGELSYNEAQMVTFIGNIFKGNTEIGSFDELQYFTGLSAVNQYAFQDCVNLESVTIPNTVTIIGDRAFYNCSGLTSVYYTGSIAQWCGIAFIGYASNPLTYAHNLCIDNQLVTDLVIPNSVTTIGQYAFYGCSGLTSVTIGNSVTTIGQHAFSGCSSLTSVTIPNSLTTVGQDAFESCNSLTGVFYLGDVNQWCNISFYNESSCPTCMFSNPLTYAHNLYINNTLLTNLVVPESVLTVKNFGEATCLNSVIISNSATSIGSTAFCKCSGLTSVTIGNSVTTIGNYAFYNCSGLTSVEMPSSVTSIGESAFRGCSGLTSVEIPNSVTSIGRYAFSDCRGLTEVTIGEGVNTIDYNAFLDCRLLATVHFNAVNCNLVPNGTRSVFASSYNNGATSIVTLTIGENVTQISKYAFFNSPNLTSMTIYSEMPPSLGYSAFYNVSGSILVYVPCGFADTYRSTSGWSSFTNIIDACPFEVNVGINPVGAATIEGTGTYTNMETCTLSYEAAYGYAILNWMENGEVVSTDDTYSFVVTEDHDITANFQYIEQHWPLPQGYEGNMTLTGIITIDGEEQTSDFIELAAFIGDECHGTALPINVNGQRVYFLTIMGDNADEGVALEFKLYDHQQQEELDLLCTNTINYQHDAVYGLDEFYVLNFLNYVVITATADPAEGGTIEGAGNHFPGLEATLTATANTGYTFQNWTKNGTVVSTNAAYTFTVTEAESYVAHFTLNSYELTVSADPTEGGSVAGGGTYNHFDECTLTATANTGYTFQNWTLNGEVVSTEAEYTFEVSGGGEYVAHFQLNSYEIAATADPAEGGTIEGAGTYNHFETCTLTATAATGYTFQNWTLEGEEVSTATELSFEVNAPAAYVAHFTLNSYEITAIANPAEGGTVSGSGTYNHFASCTLTATAADGYQFNSWVADGTTLSTEATYTFEVSGPATITAIFDLVQTVTMSNGWTWWGTSVELTSLGNDGGLGVLEQGLGDFGVIIKHGTQYAQNYSSYGYGWMGTLSKLENEKGYKIQTTQSCDVTITGPLADPDDHPIELIQGWNWIGYPVVQAQSVSSALAGLTPASGDIIKGQGPFSTYYEGMGWLPEFNLEPGKAYLYYSGNEENQTFTYANAGSRSAIVAVDDRHWRNDVHAYADNLCLWAVVSIGGEEQRTESLELGAFVDGECRGSAKLMYVAPFDRYYALMTVAGESGETIEFALLDEAHNQVSTDCTCHITFVNDAIVGGFETPYQVDFGTMTVIEEYASNLYMYPNPVARNAAFNLVLPEDETVAELYIVDMKGAVVRHETGAISHHSTSGLPTSGLYVICAVCKSGKVYQSRLAVD